MTNKVYFYTASTEIESLNFAFFSADGTLELLAAGSQNQDDVWEAQIVQGTLDAGQYTLVAISGTRSLGKEEIVWDGDNIIAHEEVIASAIRNELSVELAHVIALQNGLTENQATMLLELYRLMGLDPARPLYVDKTSRTVLPEITQTINDNSTRTIVTREV